MEYRDFSPLIATAVALAVTVVGYLLSCERRLTKLEAQNEPESQNSRKPSRQNRRKKSKR